MKITIQEYEVYKEQDVLALYESVGWSNYTNAPEMLSQAFHHSLKVLAAFDQEDLVGIIRVVGDGYSIVFVQDLLVKPAYQRQGIGRALLDHILAEYVEVYQLHLLTDDTEKTLSFYRALGFEKVDNIGASALTWQRKL